MKKGKPIPRERILARLESAMAKQAKAELDLAGIEQEYAQLIVEGELDMVSSARHRRNIAEARSAIEGWADQCAVSRAMLEGLDAQELRAQAERKRAEAQRLAVVWQTEVDQLQECAKALVARFDAAAEAGLNFRAALPWLAKASGEETTLMWGERTLARATWLYLFGATSGRLEQGGPMMSAWQVAQGPDLIARARESIARVMALGNLPDTEPPPEAA